MASKHNPHKDCKTREEAVNEAVKWLEARKVKFEGTQHPGRMNLAGLMNGAKGGSPSPWELRFDVDKADQAHINVSFGKGHTDTMAFYFPGGRKGLGI